MPHQGNITGAFPGILQALGAGQQQFPGAAQAIPDFSSLAAQQTPEERARQFRGRLIEEIISSLGQAQGPQLQDIGGGFVVPTGGDIGSQIAQAVTGGTGAAISGERQKREQREKFRQSLGVKDIEAQRRQAEQAISRQFTLGRDVAGREFQIKRDQIVAELKVKSPGKREENSSSQEES